MEIAIFPTAMVTAMTRLFPSMVETAAPPAARIPVPRIVR